VGDQGCARLSAGAYATKVALPAGQLMPVPNGVDLVTAAALPEVACTVWSNVFMVAGLRPEETLLVHGGAGGIGTFAIQLAVAYGARVFTTAGTPEKRDLVRELGAEIAIDYREEDFVEVVKQATDGAGADVILDNMGASYLPRNIESLGIGGRLIVLGLQGGTRGELDLGAVLVKRAMVHAAGLRGRPPQEKAAIVAETQNAVWPMIESGQVRPIIDRILTLDDAGEAHRLLDSSEHIGKVVLRVR
jgi:putative PIG3 family NAD(P)H quinone oxidoreductase